MLQIDRNEWKVGEEKWKREEREREKCERESFEDGKDGDEEVEQMVSIETKQLLLSPLFSYGTWISEEYQLRGETERERERERCRDLHFEWKE